MDAERESLPVPVKRELPVPDRRLPALVAAGSRALVAAVRNPVLRRVAAFGMAVGAGYQLNRALQAPRVEHTRQEGVRPRRPEHAPEPAVLVWMERRTVSVTRVRTARRRDNRQS